jgi:Xaa-Pro aminopeptidase
MFDKKVYIERRQKLKKAVSKGLIFLLGNEESSMNYKDNLYPFRQDSSFLYFMGIDRPELMAVIDIDNDKEILFGDDLTTEQIIWTGYREPLKVLCDRTGITNIKRKSELATPIKEAVKQKRTIHFLPPYRPEHVELLSFLLGVPGPALAGMVSTTLINAVVAQRSYKSSDEVAEISKGVTTTVNMQLAAITMAKAGMTEAQLAGKLQSIAIGDGGNLSFPTILTQNGQILHNGYSQSKLVRGNLVLCDCGAATAGHYAGDLTRTFPVNKKFTSIQRTIYDIVLNAHESAVSMLKPGVLFRDIHLSACEKLVEGLQQIGVMKGNAKEAVAQGAHALFFPCGLGHMLGLDIHDMENLGEKYVGYNEKIIQSTAFGLKSLRLGKPLEAGFVLTVEPGLYFNPDLIDEWAAAKKCISFINYNKLREYRRLSGVRVEEDFLITPKGGKLLGKKLAKTPNEIEALRLT